MTATTTVEPTVWVSSTALSKQLRLSRNRMCELQALGLLKPGIHYRQEGHTSNSPKHWDLRAVEATLRDYSTRLTQQQEAV